MLGLFGVANHSIFEIGSRLKSHFKDRVPIKMVGFKESELSPGILLIPTVDRFINVIDRLKGLRCVCIVFDTPVLLEYLKPIEILDVVPHKINSFTYRFQDIHLNEMADSIAERLDNKKHIVVLQEDLDIIPRLLGDTQSSILAPILEFLYSVPNTGERLRYQTCIYGWFYTERDSTALTNSLMKILGKGSDRIPVSVKRLVTFLDSDVGVNTREILHKVAQDKEAGINTNLPVICKKYNISEFDIRYLLKAIRKSAATLDLGAQGKPLNDVFYAKRKPANT